jgi:hypothetical protein
MQTPIIRNFEETNLQMALSFQQNMILFSQLGFDIV